MGKLDAVFTRRNIPATWEEMSRTNNGKQLVIRLGHINPGSKADKIMASGGNHVDADGNSVVVHGISVPETMTDFFDSMMWLAQSGLVPTLKPGDVSALRSQYSTFRDEKFDIEMSISVADYGTDSAAAEALENLNMMRPVKIGGQNMLDILADPKIREHMTEEQIKLLSNLPGQLNQMQADIKAQSGMRYYQETFLGYPAMFFEMDNPRYQPTAQQKAASPKKSKGPSGGGFDSMAKARPKHGTGSAKLINCLGLKVGNYLVTGSLLNNIRYFPESSDYCHSLTRHDPKVEKETAEGKTYTITHWLPIESTLAAEGYCNREEATTMVQTIVNQLKVMK